MLCLITHTHTESSGRGIGPSQRPLTTHVYKRWTSLPRRDANPQSQQVSCPRPRPYPVSCMIYDMIYLLTAIGFSPGGSSTVHVYTQTIHRTTQKQYTEQHNNLGECGPCPVLASYTLTFALQLRKKHGKTSVRVTASENT